MLNRRHIRMKVMQSVYAMLRSQNDDLTAEGKFLRLSIEKIHELYALQLQVLVEIQKLAKTQIEISKKKHLATQDDINPNTKFVDNQVIAKIAESISLNDFIEAKNLNNWYLEEKYIKILWDKLKESDFYLKYLHGQETSFTADRDFVAQLFTELIAPNDKLAEYYEDQNISWSDDIPFVNTWILKDINRISSKKPFKMGKLYKDDDDYNFVSNLFTKTLLNHQEFEKDITKHTPNWDADRIANIDMILIKMAICEFLKFPSIPVKVSINEYIEISKDYSTKKSSVFVNGVLDKISKDLMASKRIEKIGRGLL